MGTKTENERPLMVGACRRRPISWTWHGAAGSLSHNTLDLRVARELRMLGDELEAKAREAQIAANAAVPPVVQAYAPNWESEIACSLDRAKQRAGLLAGATLRSIRATQSTELVALQRCDARQKASDAAGRGLGSSHPRSFSTEPPAVSLSQALRA